MGDARYIVGVDLGTTHSVVAIASIVEPRLHLLQIPQLIAPGEVSEQRTLPSFLYLPAPGELPASDRQLPWGTPTTIVGVYARKQGSRNPNGLVASAKSWICHGGVNRRAAILPWSAPETLQHVSPYEAQVAYLSHLAAAWSTNHPGAPLAEQEVVVTVPASFDESARVLTCDAAKEAGLGDVRLLEEPQAAFYDYLGTLLEERPGRQGHIDRAHRLAELRDARLILVVDVGGGTTDLTLLRVAPAENDDERGELPTIERIAVGGHLMLGGDNMDAALAFYCIQKAGVPQPNDATVWARLVQSARDAKERLLAGDAPAEAVVSYQGRGSGLVGNTKSIVVTRDEAIHVLLDGCFPFTGQRDVALRNVRSGLTTLGLPYTNDTAIPRHICSFLRRHAAAATEAGASSTDGLPRPDLLLLNGGVFQAPAIVARLLEILTRWYDGRPPQLLDHTSLSTSVARGAARYGLALRGIGSVIRGGSARAYYIGIEHQGNTRALCIAPRDLELGTRVSVPNQLFQLRLNEPVQFPLFTCTLDRVDPAGTLVDLGQGDELEALPPLETLLRSQKDAKFREAFVSVSVEAFLDEGGNLKLSLVSAELPPRRWRLDFVVRSTDSNESVNAHDSSSQKLPSDGENATIRSRASGKDREPTPPHRDAGRASQLIGRSFSSTNEDSAVELRQELEALLGPRGQWSLATCRTLADACLSVVQHRRHSPLHELSWLRLSSWTLRPGFGAGGDNARLDLLWDIEECGPVFPTKTNWGEWWILWRRVAPGLSAERQGALFERVRPWLWPEGKPRGPLPLGPVEAMRMLAALERLSPDAKARAGARFLEQAGRLGSYWPLGRVGARVLFHGPSECIVSKEQAELWLQNLFDLDWQKSAGAAFAAASIARVAGEPARDVRPELRTRVVDKLTEISANSAWIDMVLRPVHLGQSDVTRVLGDSLPSGLRLA